LIGLKLDVYTQRSQSCGETLPSIVAGRIGPAYVSHSGEGDALSSARRHIRYLDDAPWLDKAVLEHGTSLEAALLADNLSSYSHKFMSRYEHLFTLLCSPSALRPNDIDLIEADSSGTLLRRPEIDQPDEPAAYTVSMDSAAQTLNVVDPLSGSSLVTVESVVPNKLRSIKLHNPEAVIELKNKTLLSFDWSFKWQDMKFSWNRSRDALSTRDDGYTLKVSRKPDPDIMLCQ
jgi:hypothetical protein